MILIRSRNRYLMPFVSGVLLSIIGPTALPGGEPIRVMSFNIRYGKANDGENHWELRKPLVAKTVHEFSPDLLGTQETLQFQADFLAEKLPEFTYFGRSRMTTPNEHCGIFYRSERFTWLAGGHFWLSETPEVPASKSWDSSLPRMASWVLLQDLQSTQSPPLLFVNTHFDHRGSVAREESARLLRRRIAKLREVAQAPLVIVTGDFNTAEGSRPYQAFLPDQDLLMDTYRRRHPERTPDEGTFNGWQGRKSGSRIDWILASPQLDVLQAEIVSQGYEGKYPSDHFPVTAVVQAP